MTDNRSIGVFDSGVGGLSILRCLHEILPKESTLYLADIARLPYGAKSRQTVIRYARTAADFLLADQPLKLLMLACNTVSAAALDTLQKELPVPVIGTITATVKAALRHKPQAIAVLATTGTVQSKAYTKALRAHGFDGPIHEQACPLFAQLVEEQWTAGPEVSAVARRCLRPIPSNVDTIVLGCTHYCLLLPVLKELLPHVTSWIDTGEALARHAVHHLRQSNALAQRSTEQREYVVTDSPDRFRVGAKQFLGRPIPPAQVRLIDLV
ncbi:MAG: glutamate racemase [Myxococcota bacterium]